MTRATAELRIGWVLMVRGRDAADGAMITSFGAYDLKAFWVWTDEVPGIPPMPGCTTC